MQDWHEDDILFRFNTTHEYYDSFIGEYIDINREPPVEIMLQYRILIEGKFYTIPSFVAVAVSKAPMNSNPDNQDTRQTWQDKVTEDEFTKQTGSRDIIKARMEIDRVKIGAKKRQEQTDYRNEGYWDNYGI